MMPRIRNISESGGAMAVGYLADATAEIVEQWGLIAAVSHHLDDLRGSMRPRTSSAWSRYILSRS